LHRELWYEYIDASTTPMVKAPEPSAAVRRLVERIRYLGSRLWRVDISGSSGDRVVCFSPEGTRIAVGTAVGTVQILDASTGEPLTTLGAHKGLVSSCAWDDAGIRLATGSWDSTARLWDVESGQELLTLTGHRGTVRACAWDRSGQRLATAADDCTTRVWDAAAGGEIASMEGHAGYVTACAWDHAGR
jgi:WD40 repeat protein